MTAKIYMVLILLVAGYSTGFSQNLREKVNDGNGLYKDGKFEQALGNYKDAQLDDPLNPTIFFNSGDALYKMKKYKEARESFQKLVASKQIDLAARAHFNIGNSWFNENKLQESIDEYKKALDLTPNDQDAKYNLELARAKLKEQSKKQKNKPNQKKQDKKQQNGKQQQQQQSQKDKQKKQDQNKKEQQQQQEQQKKEQQKQAKKQKQEGQKEKINKQEAQRILNALRDEEQKAQKRKPPIKIQGRSHGKDW